MLVAGCAPAASTTAGTVPAATVASAAPAADAADLGAIKTYLLDKTATLKASTTTLKAASDRYYALAQAANFDYAALWAKQPAEVSKALLDAKAAWITASPLYEQMEGIVAGTPSLSQFDVNLDAGASAADGGDSVVPFDITLPNGKVLAKPGNLFGVTESTLFGTFSEYFVAGIEPDLDGNGKIDFGEVLPDANVLKGGVDLLDSTVGELATTAAPWQPTESEAFGALIGNVPTVSAFFDSWKSSRFVVTDPTKASRDFAAISRLSDIVSNVTSWQTIYGSLSPMVVKVDPSSDQQIQKSLSDLKIYVEDIYTKEQNGKRYTPEEADLLSAEAQNQATAIVGQITQVAAKLNVPVE
ncbi:MAG: EfeM/EfeO family lipoprotein [Chloroflexi bacterium]|nr:EfeM/EfeO family lipoprotein [Chloroflexota bacterium]